MTPWVSRLSQRRLVMGYQMRAIRAGRGRLDTWQAMYDSNRTVLKE